jgi:hypothetical protein
MATTTAAIVNNDTPWTRYSNTSNGVSFEYSSTWKLKYNNETGHIITVFNPLSIENNFTVGLFKQNLVYDINLYPSLHETANNTFGKINGTTIIESFTEKTINGFHTIIGKLSSDKQKSSQIILIHNGKLFTLSYSDYHDKSDTTESQATLKRIIQSLNIDK